MQREIYQRQQQEMINKFEEGVGMYEEYSDEIEEESSNESHQNNEDAYAKKAANNKELQDMLFRQLREISEEDTRKLF